MKVSKKRLVSKNSKRILHDKKKLFSIFFILSLIVQGNKAEDSIQPPADNWQPEAKVILANTTGVIAGIVAGICSGVLLDEILITIFSAYQYSESLDEEIKIRIVKNMVHVAGALATVAGGSMILHKILNKSLLKKYWNIICSQAKSFYIPGLLIGMGTYAHDAYRYGIEYKNLAEFTIK